MDLLLSVFITHQRATIQNRYNRLDIFKYTLESYSQIKWDNIYLFIELDTEFLERKYELEQYINTIFKSTNINLKFYRITKQKIWQDLFKEIYNSNEDRLVFFTQNCDHIFIDFNLDILNEGITLLKNDTISKYKTLYMSHWPEILRLSGKFNNQEYVGNYIKFTATLLDSTQIFNLNYLKYLLTELDWCNKEFTRIDPLIQQESLWNYKINTAAPPYTYENLQTIYVPLRELCRKFNGYAHVHMRTDELAEFPALKLPKELNNFYYTIDQLIDKINVGHMSPWTYNNIFIIPQEIENKIIKLYKPVIL